VIAERRAIWAHGPLAGVYRRAFADIERLAPGPRTVEIGGGSHGPRFAGALVTDLVATRMTWPTPRLPFTPGASTT
jgi:hypothetical protein